MLVCSWPVKSGKRLAHEVVFASTTHADLVPDTTQTARQKMTVFLQLLIVSF